MENEFHNIDDLFRDSFSDYSETPPPAVWPALEKRLDKDKKRRVFPLLRWYWIGVLLAFITLLGATITIYMKTTSESLVTAVLPHSTVNEPRQFPVAEDRAPRQQSLEQKKAELQTKIEKASRSKNETKPGGAIVQPRDKKHDGPGEIKTGGVAGDRDVKSEPEVRVSANAPTIGTSIYSYDDFEEEENPGGEERNRTNAEAAPGYEVNTRRKNNIVVAEMKPESAEHTEEFRSERSDVAMVEAESKQLPSGEEEEPTPVLLSAASSTKGRSAMTEPASNAVKKRASASMVSAKPGISTLPAIKAEKGMADVKSKAQEKGGVSKVGAASTKPALTGKKTESNAPVALVRRSASPKRQPGTLSSADTVRPEKTMVPKINVEKAMVSTQDEFPKPRAAAIGESDTHGQNNPMKLNAADGQERGKGETGLVKELVSKQTAEPAVTRFSIGDIAGNGKLVPPNDLGLEKLSGYVMPVKNLATMPQGALVEVSNAEGEDAGEKGKQSIERISLSEVSAKGDGTISQKTTVNLPDPELPAAKSGGFNKIQPAERSSEDAPPAKPTVNAKAKIPSVFAAQASRKHTVEPATEAQVRATDTVSHVVANPPASKKLADSAAFHDELCSDEVSPPDTASEGITPFMRFVFGINGGVESGFSMNTGNKVLIAPYIRYNFSEKVAIQLQPAIKLGRLSTRAIGDPASYHQVHAGSGAYELTGSSLVYLVFTGDTLVKREYTYTERFDSIVKQNEIGGSYAELELPVLLRYQVGKRVAVFGGLNAVLGKRITVKEQTRTFADRVAMGDTFTLARISEPIPPPPGTGLYYTSAPISSYSGPTYPANNGSVVRLGYMLGFSYEWKKRWTMDAAIQQCFMQKNIQGGYDVNRALSAPYVRFTIGYRLTQ